MDQLLKFIRRIVKFQILFLPILLLFGFGYNKLISGQIYSKKSIHLDSLKCKVFLGDSHAMCAFNDSIIPNSFNASRNSESYFQTYNKLNWMLSANPQLKVVILSYSPHNISKEQDKLILYGDRYFPLLDNLSRGIIYEAPKLGLLKGTNFYSRSYSILRHKGIYWFLSLKWDWGFPGNINDYWDYLAAPIGSNNKLYLHPVFSPRYTSIHTNLNYQTTQNALIRHFGKIVVASSESKIMISYLKKICALCQKNKVSLILINTPLHNSYRNSIPKQLLSRHRELADSLIANFNYVSYYDYSNLNLPDNYYGDGDHLNYAGNKKFSNILVNVFK
jgi:hypothetical protein